MPSESVQRAGVRLGVFVHCKRCICVATERDSIGGESDAEIACAVEEAKDSVEVTAITLERSRDLGRENGEQTVYQVECASRET